MQATLVVMFTASLVFVGLVSQSTKVNSLYKERP